MEKKIYYSCILNDGAPRKVIYIYIYISIVLFSLLLFLFIVDLNCLLWDVRTTNKLQSNSKKKLIIKKEEIPEYKINNEKNQEWMK
jgi:hypothetical protein